MKCREEISHINCSCGEEFQVIKTYLIYDEEGNIIGEFEDWDEQSTAELYYAHWDECPDMNP